MISNSYPLCVEKNVALESLASRNPRNPMCSHLKTSPFFASGDFGPGISRPVTGSTRLGWIFVAKHGAPGGFRIMS